MPGLDMAASPPFRLPLAAASARLARHHVRDVTGGRDDPRLALVVTELVTNAVVHARRSPTLAVGTDGAAVRIEVWDDGPGRPDLRPLDDEPATSGRGLALVAMVADEWGVDDGPGDGKTVWAVVGSA